MIWVSSSGPVQFSVRSQCIFKTKKIIVWFQCEKVAPEMCSSLSNFHFNGIVLIILISSCSFASSDRTNGNDSQVAPENGTGDLLLPNLEINVIPPPPEPTEKKGENLTIFELLMLNKLQNFIEDELGLERFREPIWTSTSFLINLLEASQWSLKTAQRNFRKALEWRMRNMQALDQIPERHLFDDFGIEIKGYDKEQCPVIILPVGEWRTYRSYVEKIKSFQKANDNLKLYFSNVMDQVLHKLRKNRRNPNPDCSQITLIIDMEGYSALHNSGLRFFIDSIKIFAKSYPGLLKRAYIINSPPEFLRVANSYKSTIPWDLRRRSYIFTHRAFWEYPLSQNIDSSQLPQKLGGTNIFF